MTQRAGTRRWSSLGLALLLGLVLGSWVAERYGDRASINLRVALLDQQIQRLRTRLERPPGNPVAAPSTKPQFTANCPEPWRAVGAIAGGLWGCQTPAPATHGFHPNCNVTRSNVATGTSPEQYYKAAIAGSPQLSAARPLGGNAVEVHGRLAYQARFEHPLIGPPMRVLATVFVAGQHAYAVTCTAPVANFETYSARFREIAGSFELDS